MLMGCLGLFIVVGIIGAIGKNFGSFWAVVATVAFLAFGFWADKEEKAK